MVNLYQALELQVLTHCHIPDDAQRGFVSDEYVLKHVLTEFWCRHLGTSPDLSCRLREESKQLDSSWDSCGYVFSIVTRGAVK